MKLVFLVVSGYVLERLTRWTLVSLGWRAERQQQKAEVFFRKPVLCDFVLGRDKQDIDNKVSIDSPEEKMKTSAKRD